IFTTYNNPNDTTPGGMAASYPEMKPEEFVNWYKNWTSAMGVRPNEIKSNTDFQERMYNHMLENSPEEVEKIWQTVGLNNAGRGNREFLTKLYDMGVLDRSAEGDFKMNFTNLDPETK